jgi:hypothetical protein
LAALTVRHWAQLAHEYGVDTAVIEQALLQAGKLEAWQPRKLPDTGHLTEADIKQLQYRYSRRAYKAGQHAETEDALAFQRGYDLAMARCRTQIKET